MSGFLKRKTVNPAGGVNPAQAPNVGQYGWTSFDANNVNQIIEYVNICKDLTEQTKGYADYVESRFGELEKFMTFIEIVYEELKPIIDQIQPIYTDIKVRHEDIISRHIDVQRIQNLITLDKVEIEQIKEEAITETLRIKQEAVDATTAIKDAAVAEVTVIKNQASAEADRARTEANRAEVQAGLASDSAVASAASATQSGTEAGKAAASAKEAADIAEELRKGQVYRGTWNIEANNAFPPKPDTNSVWDIVLNESSTQFVFNGETWYWGDRLLYLKDEDKFSQIESGSGVLSVNGKSGAVTLDAVDVGALPITGGILTGNLTMGSDLILGNKNLKGYNDSIILRDHANGNVTLAASKNAEGVAGDLHIGYNASGHSTRRVLMKTTTYWGNSAHVLIDVNGRLNSDYLFGPIRTEKDAAGVYHTVVGGTDAVNRGRTIIAAGEAGKVMADNTSSGAEAVHIGADAIDGLWFHTGLQDGWAGRKTVKMMGGEIYADGGARRVYHEGYKPTAVDIGAIRKSGDDGVGSLKASAGKVFDATLTHQSGYLSIYPFSSGYGLGGTSGNRARMYYKEHNNGNPSDISRGLVINSNDADGSSHPLHIWLNGSRVYNEAFKPTPSAIGAVNKAGDTMTGVLKLTGDQSGLGKGGLDANNSNIIGVNGLIFNDPSDTQNEAILFPKTGKTGTSTSQADYDAIRALDGSLLFNTNKVYHEGFKPTLADVIGADNSTFLRHSFNKPTGAVDGKYYPILLNGTNNYPDIYIETTTSSATYSMNNCSFKGQVRSGGWTDRGRYVSGDFVIYDNNERAIHSFVGSTENDNHYVIYVEARAFPITLVVNNKVNVSSTGKDVVLGGTTYKAGISGMTSSGDYGVKTSLLIDLQRGSGNYTTLATRAGYIDARGGIDATSRMNVVDYNANGAFITRRPGKPSYSMMGQDSSGNTMLGLGVDTSGYSSYLKVSAATLAYSNNGSSESRIYHEGFKPSLSELGGIASTGGTMTGALKFKDDNKFISPSGENMHLAAKLGTVVLEGKNTPIASVAGKNYNIYHVGNKPNAGDVGALAITGGTLTGKLTLRGQSSHIDLVETDAADKTWRMEAQGSNMDFTEAGVGTRLRLKAGGGATISGQLDVTGHIVGGSGTILKFPTANYSTGAQLYARDGGQFGANFVINSGGNLILGAGESGTAFADVLGASTTEHAYLTADGDAHLLSNCNTIAERKSLRFGADGNLTVNTGTTTAKVALGDNNGCISRIGPKTYVAALDTDGTVVLESPNNPKYRNKAGAEFDLYHSGNKPTVEDIALGKAIGASKALGATVDLNDFKTPGVYHQSANAGATTGVNYPEALAGSLLVYAAAGIIQEYRVYNSSKLYRRAQYSNGAWTPWTKDYNSGVKPTAAELAVLPLSGGTMSGAIVTSNRKSTITINDQASIRYKDASGAWFHNLAFGNSLKWSVGDDSSQRDVMALSSDGNLSLSGGLTTNNGITIKGNGNVMAFVGGFLRSNTDSVMAVDGKVYSFVTSPRDAHLCANAYWDGANWYKYDVSKSSMYAVANSEGQFRLYGSSASSTSPQELSAMVVDRVGNTSVGGNLTSNGQLHVGGGYAQINAGVNPMIEFHKPGTSASAIYVDGSNFLRFCSSNGSAGEAAHYFSAHGDGLLTPKKFTSTMNASRAWSSAGHAAFYNDSGETMGDGTYHGLTSMYSVYPGVYANELSFGYYNANSDWGQGNATLSNYNASTGAIFRWMFRNNGTLEPSHGGWRMPADGNIVGNAWQGGNLGDFLARHYAPLSDVNLKTVLGESKTSALEQVSQMKFHEYVWNDAGFAKKSVKVNKIGVIAQELEEIDANFTRDIGTYDEEGKEVSSVKSLDTANLLAVALKAIQEQSAQIASLQAEVADLKEKMNDLV